LNPKPTALNSSSYEDTLQKDSEQSTHMRDLRHKEIRTHCRRRWQPEISRVQALSSKSTKGFVEAAWLFKSWWEIRNNFRIKLTNFCGISLVFCKEMKNEAHGARTKWSIAIRGEYSPEFSSIDVPTPIGIRLLKYTHNLRLRSRRKRCSYSRWSILGLPLSRRIRLSVSCWFLSIRLSIGRISIRNWTLKISWTCTTGCCRKRRTRRNIWARSTVRTSSSSIIIIIILSMRRRRTRILCVRICCIISLSISWAPPCSSSSLLSSSIAIIASCVLLLLLVAALSLHRRSWWVRRRSWIIKPRHSFKPLAGLKRSKTPRKTHTNRSSRKHIHTRSASKQHIRAPNPKSSTSKQHVRAPNPESSTSKQHVRAPNPKSSTSKQHVRAPNPKSSTN